MNQDKFLDISWGTILKIGIAGLSFYLAYLIRDIILWIIFGVIISILLDPLISFLTKKRIPKILAVIIVYLIIFGILGSTIFLIIPVFISEIKQFSQFFTEYFNKVSPILRTLGFAAFQNFDTLLNTLSANLERITSNIFNVITTIFGGIFSTIFILSIAIFVSLEEKFMERGIKIIFPQKYESYALSLWQKLERKIGGWFLIKIFGCVFIGLFSYIIFLVFSTKYPLILALIAGILNFIPIVGPLITGALIFIITSLDSVTRAIFVEIAFIVIQQIEGNIFTPILTKKFIGLSPVLVLIALAIGGKLWGVMGAILAIPLFGIVFEFVKEYFEKRKRDKPVVL